MPCQVCYILRVWISFPLSRGVRVIMPWPIAVLLLPVALAAWVLSLTWAAIRWVWRPRSRRKARSGDTIRIRISG